ncbi:uncharacterized protein THITE_2120487 [Thermothielavioides terrestris NRRL 8126]|uniref:Arrestin C-terminal-like domain-containing protein n=1 Tax=Thermothielavioides terrestris (strain ATCC 38088 / NRRL 8126) TaxID=578455 RepID=G2RAT0_THETT|nr:uncharacterized protein THITE_2120487 [Thermothielavioides terrestris NRRL 8126]AEO69761.1 hypothetical protein THITE_2120487 [Thermothielavioides terrestris NRRL 8126]
MPVPSGTRSNRPAVSHAGPEHDRLRPQPYFESAHGSVYYSPQRPANRRRRPTSGNFPAPLIEPRQRRPHSIHIISYPPGFVPRELRPESPESARKKSEKREKREKKEAEKREAKERKKQEKARRRAEKERSERQEKRRSLRSLPPAGERVTRVLGKIFAALSITPKPSPAVSATPPLRDRSRPSSFISFARRFSWFEPTLAEPILVAEEPVAEPPNMTGGATVARPTIPTVVPPQNRNSIMSIRSAKTMMSSSVSEVQKPVASGSGLTCSILLAEPNVFLTGFDHDHHSRRGGQATSALLRGKLQLNVSKNVKIKSVTLRLVGKARTEWPEGIPPAKTEFSEEQTLRTQSLVFFHAMHQSMWDTEYGSQCSYTHKRSALQPTASSGSLHLLGRGRSSNLTAKELQRLSLRSVNSRSFGKGDSPHINQVQAKGYKVFRPGTYEYTFELPIDHNQLETTKLPYGSVRWDLETTVERAGAFKPNLHGSREVSIVRLPDQMSLETVEPISISRTWEDQLHYDIVISGKSFPIGGKIPIAFKLTPLAKVQIHKLKVFVTENIEYWTNDRHVTRKDAGRKLLLLEKTAGKPLDQKFAGSEIRVLSGGELDPDQREEARRTAIHRRIREAARTRGSPEPLPEPSENLLGDLDLGLESFWGSTEMEMNVQLPTCEAMARDKSLRLHPDCSWKNVNVYHWIKIVMRISRVDPEDPAGKRRRHFEISIDSPFTALNCRATQANTSLPRYCGGEWPIPEQRQQMSCGCPDAQALDPSLSGAAGSLAMVEEDLLSLSGRRLRLDPPGLPSVPQAAHLQPADRLDARQGTSSNPPRLETSSLTPGEQDRPIHLLRRPSHNPPAFDADDPPPPLLTPLLTPPPRYDLIVGTPSVDGLADYFSRLAAYEGMCVAGGANGNSHTEDADADADNSDASTTGPGTDTGISTEPTSTSAAGQSAPLDDVDPFSRIRLPACSPAGGGAAGGGGGGGGEGGGEAEAETESGAPPVADDDASSASDSADDDGVRPHRRGRVNVANPRTPGGRLVPSRSLELERPAVRLDMAAVLRRRNHEG